MEARSSNLAVICPGAPPYPYLRGEWVGPPLVGRWAYVTSRAYVTAPPPPTATRTATTRHHCCRPTTQGHHVQTYVRMRAVGCRMDAALEVSIFSPYSLLPHNSVQTARVPVLGRHPEFLDFPSGVG